MIVLGSLLTLGVCAFAFHRGGEAERGVSVAALVVLFSSLIAQAIFGRHTAWPVIAADLALGVTVGVLAAIHLRIWLYVECAIAAALLLVHGAVLLTTDATVTPVYASVVNGLNLLMLGTLMAAALRRRSDGELGTPPVETVPQA